MDSNFSSAARLVVVSGGGTGIGRAIAATFAAEGAHVVVVGRRESVLDEAAENINSTVGHRAVTTVAADLSDVESVRTVAQQLTRAGRTVDVLVNNAGGNLAPGTPEDLEAVRRDWIRNMTGNVLPAVLLTQALLPALRRPGGRIVTITSIAAFRGPATYGGAKAALHPWAAELAVRLAPQQITVNTVAPGYIESTEFYGDRMSPEFHAGRAGQAPMNRGGSVQEVAAAVRYLASPEAAFVTGQILQINGGALLGRG